MTTLVETSEEEPTMAVARAIAELAWFEGGQEVSHSLRCMIFRVSSPWDEGCRSRAEHV